MDRLRKFLPKTLGVKIAISVLVLIFCSTIFISLVIYYTSVAEIERQMGLRAQGIATTASLLIDQDLHQKIVENPSEYFGHAAQKYINKELLRIKKANNLSTDIYVYAKTFWLDNTVMFSATSNIKESKMKGMPLDPRLQSAFQSKQPGFSELFTTMNGTWIAGYAPIFTKHGAISGLVEVPFDVSIEIKNTRKNLFQKIGLAFVFTLGICIFITLFMSNLITQRIKIFIDTVTSISSCGRWHSKVEKKSDDELGALADQINNMIDRIQAFQQSMITLKDKAEHSNRLKSEFLANMSHEIRTPLNAIIGNAQLLSYGDITLEQKKFANSIRSASDSLLSLVNDILDFSKIEAGELSLDRLDFSIRDVLQEAVDIFEYEKTNIRLITHVYDDVPNHVSGDPYRLKQVIINLLNNAVKFTDYGQITICAANYNDCNKGDPKLLFTVEDTGIGIRKEDIPALFEPFIQADGSASRKYEGTGLGLAICKKIVNIFGGEIWVESELGRGSKFCFTMSFEEGKSAHSTLIKTSQLSPTSEAKYSALDILVAEDNLANQEVISQFLQKIGHRVTIVSNGFEAIQQLKGQKDYSLILMDCQMPIMDGFEATKNIRKSGSKIPIVALTANAMKGDKERCIQSGMDDYVPKPINYFSLEMLLNRFMTPDLTDGDFCETNKNRLDLAEKRLDPNAIMLLKGLSSEQSPNFAKDRIYDFIQVSRREESSIIEFFASKDFDSIAFTSHRFKTNCGIVGANLLMNLCTKMEDEAKNRDFNNLGPTIEDFCNEVNLIIDLCNIELSKIKESA